MPLLRHERRRSMTETYARADGMEPMPDLAELLFDGEPIPLATGRPLSPFPTEALPQIVKNMVEAAAAALQVDVGATATSALTSMAAACGGRVFIQIKPGWVEPTNLYTVTVADPGERKSSTQEVMMTGLVEAELALDAEGEDERHRLTYQHDVAEKAFEKAKIAAGRAEAGKDRELALDLVKQEHDRLLELVIPAQPQIVFGDLTPEATAMALQDQGGKVAVITAEGGLFGTVAGRYSGGQVNVDVFTQGYSGEAVRVKRVGREDVKVPRACITLGLMVQPEVMREVGGNKALTGRGLVDRFLFCEPKSLVGHRDSRSTPIPTNVKTSYDHLIKTLVLMLNRASEPITLTLSTEAQDLFYDVMDVMENEMRPEGDCHEIRGWAAKHAGRIGRIAALLHMVDSGADTRVVSAATIMAATQIGRYYLIHALRAYSQMQLDGDTQDAVYLLTRLRQHFAGDAGDTITEREIQRLCQKFKTKEELVPALNRLEDNGWIFPESVKTDGPGRPPSPIFTPHPKLRPKSRLVAV
jgi:replicative DNA helicase